MKNETTTPISPNKSESINKDSTNNRIINKNEDNLENKLKIKKLKLNIKNSDKEIKTLWQRTVININPYKKNKKKLSLNTKDNDNKNNNLLYNAKHKTRREDNSCSTDRANNNDNKQNNKTLFNNFVSQNLNINKNNERMNALLLSPKKYKKNKLFNKTNNKNITSDVQISDETNNNNKNGKLSKHKSSQNFKIGIFSKIKSPNRNKDEISENNKNISKNKIFDKDKLNDNFEYYFTLNSTFSRKIFNKKNKNISLESFTNKISNKNKNKSNKINTEEDIKNLDTIIEDNKKNNRESHHYLENTISRKNKMIKKRKDDILQAKDFEKNKKINNKLIKRKINIIIEKEYQYNKSRNPKLLENKHINNANYKTNLNNIKKKTNSIDNKSINNASYTSNTDKNKIFNGKLENYLITKELGKGSCAVVKLATHKITKEKYAIKIYTKEFLLDPQKRKIVKNEINILKQLNNEYIMKLYEEIDTPDYLYLVLEYINGIPLIDILKNEEDGFLIENRAKKLIIQIIKGIIYLHSQNICHRDIKLENILVMKNDLIKIIDFGFAVKCNKGSYLKVFCGSPSYMAPEVLNKEKYIPYYSDIWSLGVLFFAMLYGRFPFDFNNINLFENSKNIEKITNINFSFSNEIKVDDKIKNIFNKIFIFEPKERIKLEEILDILYSNNS